MSLLALGTFKNATFGGHPLRPPSDPESHQIGPTKVDPAFSSNKITEEELMKHLHRFIMGFKASMGMAGGVTRETFPYVNQSSHTHLTHRGTQNLRFNLSLEDLSDLNEILADAQYDVVTVKNLVIMSLYAMIGVSSIIGNLLVVQLVMRSRRLHTLTHVLLANLAVADLLMATINVPLSAVRVILLEWPFGSVMCRLVPFIQVTSVYVNSITMTVIALDRYQVITDPLARRLRKSIGFYLVTGIWTFSALLSLPFAIHHQVVTVLTVRVVERCQADFSSPMARRWLTVGTFLAQYVFPLLLTTMSYVFIMRKLGLRSAPLGSTTPRQVVAHSKAKRTTIKMLALTVIFFAACWFPINAYHLLTHFHLVSHSSTVILTCHLIAMSSTCCNPFIYCWLNEHFRQEAMKWLFCFCRTRHNRSQSDSQPPGVATDPADDKNLKRDSRLLKFLPTAPAQNPSSSLRGPGSKKPSNGSSTTPSKSDGSQPASSSNSIFRVDPEIRLHRGKSYNSYLLKCKDLWKSEGGRIDSLAKSSVELCDAEVKSVRLTKSQKSQSHYFGEVPIEIAKTLGYELGSMSNMLEDEKYESCAGIQEKIQELECSV